MSGVLWSDETEAVSCDQLSRTRRTRYLSTADVRMSIVRVCGGSMVG